MNEEQVKLGVKIQDVIDKASQRLNDRHPELAKRLEWAIKQLVSEIVHVIEEDYAESDH